MISKVLFINILLIACVLRLYNLDKIPNGLYADEAAIGYSAYSILLSGKDEFGKSLPIIFKSFSDFKTPVYIYLTSIFVYFFDLNILSVRLLSALSGVGSVVILYFLVNQIITTKNLGLKFHKLKLSLGHLAAFLLAISPWHVLISRSAFEVNLGLFFYLLALYLFYRSLEVRNYLIYSSVFFAISLTTYHAFRLLVPLTILFLSITYFRDIYSKINIKQLFISIILGFLILAPTIGLVNTKGFMARATGLSIFENPTGVINHISYDSFLNNKILLSLKEYYSLYTSYFTIQNMFFLGDSDIRMKAPQLATFYVWQIPFYLFGFYFLIFELNNRKVKFLLLFLLLVSPMPAALTRDPYSTIRSLPIVIPQIILISLGIFTVIHFAIKYFKYGNIIIIFFFIFASGYSILRIYSSLFLLMPYYNSHKWDYGWKQVVDVVKTENYDNLPVLFDNSRDEAYIFVAFFDKTDPIHLQEYFILNNHDYYNNLNHTQNIKFSNYETRGINWEIDLYQEKIIVADALGISNEQINTHNLKIIKDIKYPDGSIAFRIVRTQLPSGK